MEEHKERRGLLSRWSWRGGMGPLLGLLLLLSLSAGPVETTAFDVIGTLGERLTLGALETGVTERNAVVIWDLRLPRALTALVTGAALAMAGACLQGLFRNPLADPGLIGVSSGGAIGAILAISLLPLLHALPAFLQALQLPIWSMLGATGTTFLVYRLARIAGKTHVSTLLLAGVAVNALAGAIVGGVLYLSDDYALRRFTFWTLGSLHNSGWPDLLLMAPFILGPALLLPRYRRALNAFLLGEAEAYHLGFPTQAVKNAVILLCAAMVGVTVAFCGLIGFVGLVVPHLVRLLRGPDFRRLLPGSAFLGALIMLGADFVARTANAPSEIPIGVLTALLGAPFFLYLIERRKRQLAA